ncbi:hypothetical protein OPV22_020210, partial [Ensete ventricosum]
GIFASGISFTLLGWCIKKKGPVYASVFNPLMLVLVAILSSLLLNEKLYLGCLLGAALIVIGLYIVLWGKGREASKIDEESLAEATRQSIDVVIAQEAATDPGFGNALVLPLVPSYLISTPSSPLLVVPSLSVRPHRVIAAASRRPFTPIPDPAHRQERGEEFRWCVVFTGCGQQFPERALSTGLLLEMVYIFRSTLLLCWYLRICAYRLRCGPLWPEWSYLPSVGSPCRVLSHLSLCLNL